MIIVMVSCLVHQYTINRVYINKLLCTNDNEILHFVKSVLLKKCCNIEPVSDVISLLTGPARWGNIDITV